jgi:signal transduction histidine kinase
VAFARAIGNQIVQSLDLETSFRRLEESEQRYRTLMANASDAIAILTPDGVVREVNRRLEQALELPRERILGRKFQDLVTAAREPFGPVEMTRRDGSRLLIQLSDTVVDVGGERLVLSIGRDVTEQMQAQAQLMVSDRMASVGMLAAGVAHEINNPLSTVTGNLELAAKDLDALVKRLGPEAGLATLQEGISDAREAAERVRTIVRDLKIFSRAEEDRRTAVDVIRVLDSSLRMAWNEIRHRARIAKDYGKVPPVLGNESRLGQVFLNLIVNAAQAIQEGRADDNEIRVRTAVAGAGGAVIVDVVDTGPGIPPELLKKLFTPFFTTKPQGVGTGLGLAICQRIVNGLGGEISVTSVMGKGTTFRVTLPAARLEETIPALLATPVTAARRAGRILIVDDEPKVAQMVRRMLVQEHEVQVLTEAAEALALISAGERFDVILCDVMMPVMTGMELHEQLRRTAPDQADRIVFLTGGAFTPRARAFLDEVPNPRLEKPFALQTLRALINERLT